MAEQKPHWTESLITIWELKGIWIFYHSICYFSKSWNRFDQHLNKSLLPQDPWMDLLQPLSSYPSQSSFPQANQLKDSCQEIYRTAVAGISHRGSQWLLPGIYHQHTNEERQNCPGRETSSSRWPCGRAAASALHSHQYSQENALHKRSWKPSWWEVRPFKSNREHNLHQDQGGEATEQRREPHSGSCSLFLTYSQLSVPTTATSYLRSTGGHYNKPTLSPTVHITHSHTLPFSFLTPRNLFHLALHLPKSTTDLV